jgi:hypothetical protein
MFSMSKTGLIMTPSPGFPKLSIWIFQIFLTHFGKSATVGLAASRTYPMTGKASFTQAAVRRNIEAARKSGFQVTAIKADGTVILEGGNGPASTAPAAQGEPAPEAVRWGDDR